MGLHRSHSFIACGTFHFSHVVIPQVRKDMRLISCMYIPLIYIIISCLSKLQNHPVFSRKYFREMHVFIFMVAFTPDPP